MKKIKLVVCMMAISLYTFGQIVHNDTVNHCTMTTYAGILGGPVQSVENESLTTPTTLRVGGMIQWKPNSWSSLYGLGAVEANQTGTISPFSLLGVTLSPIKSVTITLGKIATPMTKLRPLPITGSGQFESWTVSQIPGSAIGGSITGSFSKEYSLSAGSFVRGSDVSVEAGLGIPYTQIAGYYMANSRKFGGAINCNYKLLSTTLMYNSEKNAGMFDAVKISQKHNLFLYSDIGFSINNWNMVRGEWGVFKTFSVQYLSSILGVGYSKEIKSVKGYVFIHL